MVVPAAVGWLVGVAWWMEFLPGTGTWRVPAWIVGEKERRVVNGAGGDGGRYEDLRRRLEGEAIAASASSSATGAAGDTVGQRLRRSGGL